MESCITFPLYVMNYHTLSDLKDNTYPFIREQFCRSASYWCAMPGFSESHQVSQGQIKVPWGEFSCGVKVLFQANMVVAEFSFLQL